MTKFTKFILLFFMTLTAPTVITFGQNADKVSIFEKIINGQKLYVVILVILVIFLGLVFWLCYQERKIGKIEKLINDNNSAPKGNSNSEPV